MRSRLASARCTIAVSAMLTAPAALADTPVTGGLTQATAGVLAPTTTTVVEGEIAQRERVDWFQVTPPAGYVLRVMAIGSNSPITLTVQVGDHAALSSLSTDAQMLGPWKTNGERWDIAITPDNLPCDYVLIVSVVPLCGWDAQEPNNLDWTTFSVADGDVLNGVICPGDIDYFTASLAAGETLKVAVDLKHANGDLNLQLINNRNQHRISESQTDHELVRYTADKPEPLIHFWVYGAEEQVRNNSTRTVTITPPAGGQKEIVPFAPVPKVEQRPSEGDK